MDNLYVNKDYYFKKHNIKANVKREDILAPKEVQAIDILLGKTQDKLVNKMSDIFPKAETPDE